MITFSDYQNEIFNLKDFTINVKKNPELNTYVDEGLCYICKEMFR